MPLAWGIEKVGPAHAGNNQHPGRHGHASEQGGAQKERPEAIGEKRHERKRFSSREPDLSIGRWSSSRLEEFFAVKKARLGKTLGLGNRPSYASVTTAAHEIHVGRAIGIVPRMIQLEITRISEDY